MDNCIFCRIVKGELPSYKVWENANYLAFLTIRPINPGHVLVIPKEHTEYFYDLDDKELGDLVIASKPVAKALRSAMNPITDRVGVMVAGMGVPHVHLHLIPMDSESDLTFARAKDGDKKELLDIQERIKESLNTV